MKVDTIQSNRFAKASYRIDPSFHLSEGIKIRGVLAKSPYGLLSIKDVTEKVFIGNIFSRVFVNSPDHGTPYLAASDTVLSDLDTGRLLSNKQVDDLSYLVLDKDWILSTCSGTLGKVSYTNEIYKGRIATHDLIRMIPNDRIKRGCVYAFLSSKYGYYQLTESKFGGVVKHINSSHAESIVIPDFSSAFQEHIDSMVREVAKLREEAYYAINEARYRVEMLLKHEESTASPSVSVKKILNSYTKRFEGMYYVSTNRQHYDYIKASGIKYILLKDLTEKIFKPNIFKRSYVEKGGVELLGGADIMNAIPASTKQISQRQFQQMPELKIERNTILVTRAGTIGNTMITDSHLSKKAVSEDVLRIVPNDKIQPGYLFAFLTSSIGSKLITLYTYGSVIQHIEYGHLERIPVPIFDTEVMNQINDLAMEYVDKIERAKDIELSAISLVESEIDNWK